MALAHDPNLDKGIAGHQKTVGELIINTEKALIAVLGT